MYYISKKKDDDKGLSRVLKGDKCEIAQRESFRVGSSLGKNDFRQQRLCTIHSVPYCLLLLVYIYFVSLQIFSYWEEYGTTTSFVSMWE